MGNHLPSFATSHYSTHIYLTSLLSLPFLQIFPYSVSLTHLIDTTSAPHSRSRSHRKGKHGRIHRRTHIPHLKIRHPLRRHTPRNQFRKFHSRSRKCTFHGHRGPQVRSGSC